ncbi:MAG: HEAT repeat domain-containing protein [Deltaproteobacteria bacterium]|nr:HEAT repeat domain-containing protein [Deltaproteobacteria bacterium]MCB9786343.1 HEAT repeat domain-containing protein [Deltaproteobacteria bacterium]
MRPSPLSTRATRSLALAACLACLVGGCRGEEGGPAQPSQPAAAPAPEVAAAPDAELGAALTAMRDRHRCNRLMGCEPAKVVASRGSAAVPALLDTLEQGRGADGFWMLALLDLLGAADDERALPLLERWLSDPRWEVRTRAALALAKLGRPSSAEALQAALAAARGRRGDVAFEAALMLALVRLGETVQGQPARAALQERLALDHGELATMNPGFYAVLTEIVARADLPEALPLVRLGITHRDRYVRIGAIAAAGSLHDTGAIPFLVGRLDDRLPSVRRAAVAALREITGSQGLTDAAQWTAWCEARGCRSDLSTGMPPGTPPPPPADAPDAGEPPRAAPERAP